MGAARGVVPASKQRAVNRFEHHDETGSETERNHPWPRLTRRQRTCIAATTLLIAAVGIAHLPPGVCFADSGDLQVASATLGIAHPPGYVGYAAVGWLLCKALFFLKPAYVVSLACLACVVLSLAMLAALLVRMGLHVLGACSLSLLLVAHQSPLQSTVWQSMGYPEVYAPSWLLLIGATHLLFKYGCVHRAGALWTATFLFGFLVTQRPPSALFAPGFLLAWLLIERRHRTSLKRAAGLFLGGLLWALVPVVLVIGLVWTLDAPGTDYNGIEQYAEGHGGLPSYSDGYAAKLRRVQWLITAEQFAEYVATDRHVAASRLRYIRRVLHLFDRAPFACFLVLVCAGVWVSARGGGERAVLPLGLMFGNIAFLCMYRIYGQAANLLPTVFAAALPVGSVLAKWLPNSIRGGRRWFAVAIYTSACVWTVYHGTTRYAYAGRADATQFLAEVDLAALPGDSVIFAVMANSCPIWYARSVTLDRKDIDIVVGPTHRWAEVAGRYIDRPVFYTEERGKAPAGWTAEPSGVLRRLTPDQRPRD